MSSSSIISASSVASTKNKLLKNLQHLIKYNNNVQYKNYNIYIKDEFNRQPIITNEHVYITRTQNSYSFNHTLTFLLCNVKSNNIVIDGTCGVGKTSILSTLHRPIIKVSQYINDTNRNYDSIVAINYILTSCMMIDTAMGCVFDRSPISNLAWLIIPQVYSNYKLLEKMTTFGLINTILENSQLYSALRFINKKKYNVIIIIDTDIKYVCDKLKQRKSSYTDILAAHWPMYVHVQNMVYSTLAKILNYPCIDINYLREFAKKDGITENEMYNRISCVLEQNMNIEIKYPTIMPQEGINIPIDDIIKRRLIHKR